MRRIFSLLLSLCLVLSICACGQKATAPTWQEQYDLGIRYLSEGDYEEAIIAFTAAIEIDPKQAPAYSGRGQAYVLSGETADNLAAALADFEAALAADETLAEAWLGLADVYIRQGDYDKAMEVLQEGLDKTGGEAIADKIAEIESGNVTDSSGNTRRESIYGEDGSLRCYFTYTYDAQSRMASCTGFDAAGNQADHLDLAYDEAGNQVVGIAYWVYDGTIGKAEMEYDEAGHCIKELDYQNGRLNGYWQYSYDDAGNRIRAEYYYPESGKLQSYALYQYDVAGNIVGIQYYNGDGTLHSSSVYTHNENGTCISCHDYNGNGQLTQYSLYIYDENGKQIVSEHYDADGNLTSRTTYE